MFCHTVFVLNLFLLLSTSSAIAQKSARSFYDVLTQQDSLKLKNNQFWITLSGGPSLTFSSGTTGLFLFGPGIDFNWISKNYRYHKAKISFHKQFEWGGTLAQKTIEVNLMTGKMARTGDKEFHTFTYGLGVIAGVKKGKLISQGGGPTFGISFTGPDYQKQEFIFLCLPLEYKYQIQWLGIGADANLNPYLPYVGIKLMIQFGMLHFK